MNYEQIIERLSPDILEMIDLEWEMFDQVHNIGGRADCQDNRPVFYCMRGSQFNAWNPQMRQSYLQDLKSAQSEGNNLLTFKYGYMMQQTDPEAFARIAEQLPPRSREKLALVEQLTGIQVAWQEELSAEFPSLTGRGRVTHSSQERDGETSFETYLRGELSTYSMRTLQLYSEYVDHLRAEGKNLNRMILEKEAELYGYTSLEEAAKRNGSSV